MICDINNKTKVLHIIILPTGSAIRTTIAGKLKHF